MDRRSFIKLTAVTGTSGALAACGNPEHTVIRFVPDDAITPGIAQWKPSVCPLCASGCGLTVRIMDADVEVTRDGQAGVVRKAVAKKLEGSPAHPVNSGGLCPRGQAAIQVTYHPDRITQPLKRAGARGEGRFEAISWDQALTELIGKLDQVAAASQQRGVVFLGRPGRSHRQLLIGQFLERYGAPAPVAVELFGDDVLRRANALSFGMPQLPTIDLARARYTLSFGADFLGTWNSPVAQNVAYGVMRQGRPGIRGAFVQAEARMSPTGAVADEWVAVPPGLEGVLALGLAHIIMATKLAAPDAAGPAGALIDGWAAGLADYTPDRVATATGVAAKRLERLARAFATTRPGAAVVGGAALAQTNGLFTALAVNALNALVGAVGQPGGLMFTPELDVIRASRPATTPGQAAPASSSWAAGVLSPAGTPAQVLLLDQANPVFAAPPAWRLRDACEQVPFIASFGSFLDETSVLADLILPDHSFLESWVDALPESGSVGAVASVAAPAMRPLYDTRSLPDVLLDVGRRLQRPLVPALPWESFEAMLQATFAALPPATPGEDTWTASQERGGWWGSAETQGPRPAERRLEVPARTFARAEPQFDGDVQQYPFHFLPYASASFLDGALAHLPWLQELPDPLTSAMWSSWVEINPETAERLGIVLGDIVEVASAHGSVQAPAVIFPGVAPNVVAMPAGQGHKHFTRYATGRGVNPAEILAPTVEPETGSLAWAATRVRISRIAPGDDRLILFAGEMREHSHEHER